MNIPLIIDRWLERLESFRSTRALAIALLPILLLQLLPTAFIDNEFNYFMLAFKRVSPESFAPYSAAFNASNARYLSEFVIGNMVALFGYEGAHAILRIVMAVGYAVSIAYFLSALGLSAAAGIMALAAYLLLGPDLMGGEWLFQGVESKTFAYACVFFALGALLRERRAVAVSALVVATYFHFLVGGFWLVAALALDMIRDRNGKRTAKLFIGYCIATTPLLGVIFYDQVISQNDPAAFAHQPTADFIYSIMRLPHHVAPFSSLSQLHAWAGGIASTVALLFAAVAIFHRLESEHRPFALWIIGLLLYLSAALLASAFDARTGHLGKFFLFRPSALTLFLIIILVTSLFQATSPKPYSFNTLRKGLLLFLIPVVLLGIVDDRLTDLFGVRQQSQTELREANEYIQRTSKPEDIVLVDPSGELQLTDGAAPFYIRRPTLVSWKFTPHNAKEIRHWYGLIQYRRRVFKGACGEIGRYPIRYLLTFRQNPDDKPPCGKIVWRSAHYALADVSEYSSQPAPETRP